MAYKKIFFCSELFQKSAHSEKSDHFTDHFKLNFPPNFVYIWTTVAENKGKDKF
jgi:hypothetical protein